ncbi:response regulator transcription factor [Actinoplanes sp. URMC 104]|uniref:response regulator transcription factor n=1 Tax=Actinoplanes sp. URMC 104 TaxID=3423409 RepID=UPI003F1CDF6B
MPTVLVADDDVDHRDLMAFGLKRAGYEVVPVAGAGEALEALLGGGIDAALLDVRMPGMDGIELCRRLRAEPATEILPIMLISAHVDDQRILAGLHAGADDYLTKPFHRTELGARVGNLLVRRHGASRRAAQVANAALLAARGAIGRTPHLEPVRRSA